MSRNVCAVVLVGYRRLKPGFKARTRIEVIAQRVADEVECEHGEHDREGGKEHEMRRVEQMSAAVVEHGAPAGGGRRHAKSEKTHGGFGENGSGHADGSLHDNWLNNVGENMADDDAEIASPQSAGGFDKFAFARREDLSADQAGVADPASQRERENKIEDAGAAEGDEGDGEKDSREREKRVHQDDVDKAVDATTVVSGDGADEEPECERGEHHAASDQHRYARTVDDARENVAPEFVGPEPVRVRWTAEARGKIDGGRILRRDPGSEKGEGHEHDNQRDPRRCKRVMASVPRNPAAERDGGCGHDERLN